MPKIPITYIELPALDIPASKHFYSSLFGWTFEDFGPDYAAFHEAGVEGGFNGDAADRSAAPLVVLQTEDLERTFEEVKAAGGIITAPIFPFPGGRRFHFKDPAGNELAILQPA